MWTPRPLAAVIKDNNSILLNNHQQKNAVPTAYVHGVAECSSNLWVKFDHEITFVRDLIVTSLYKLRYPHTEIISDDGVDDIDDPLSWKLDSVSLVWHMLFDFVDLQSVLK